jgi:hypothetical protein
MEKIAFWDEINFKKLDISVKTDNYDIIEGDIGSLIILDSSIDKYFNLPEVTTSLLGQIFRIASINIGRLTIRAYSGQLINGYTTVYCVGKYHVIELLCNSVSQDHIVVFSTEGQISNFWEFETP